MDDAQKTVRLDSCGSCRWFNPSDKGAGECRVRPPTVLVVVVTNALRQQIPTPLAAFPTVRPDTWCGEWTELNA